MKERNLRWPWMRKHIIDKYQAWLYLYNLYTIISGVDSKLNWQLDSSHFTIASCIPTHTINGPFLSILLILHLFFYTSGQPTTTWAKANKTFDYNMCRSYSTKIDQLMLRLNNMYMKQTSDRSGWWTWF